MGFDTTFFVRAGELLRAAPWNAAAKAIRALRLIAGYGVRLRETSNGTIITFDARGAMFIGRFKCQLQGTEECLVKPGAVNKVSATIKGVPLEGNPDEDRDIPVLDISDLKLDEDGKGYIAVEVTCAKEDWAVETAEIVQVAYLHSDNGVDPPEGEAKSISSGGTPNLPGRRARHPLAMIRKRSTGALELFQITFHDLGHRVRTSSDNPEADEGRHFFYAEG